MTAREGWHGTACNVGLLHRPPGNDAAGDHAVTGLALWRAAGSQCTTVVHHAVWTPDRTNDDAPGRMCREVPETLGIARDVETGRQDASVVTVPPSPSRGLSLFPDTDTPSACIAHRVVVPARHVPLGSAMADATSIASHGKRVVEAYRRRKWEREQHGGVEGIIVPFRDMGHVRRPPGIAEERVARRADVQLPARRVPGDGSCEGCGGPRVLDRRAVGAVRRDDPGRVVHSPDGEYLRTHAARLTTPWAGIAAAAAFRAPAGPALLRSMVDHQATMVVSDRAFETWDEASQAIQLLSKAAVEVGRRTL